MPELPEVETLARAIDKLARGLVCEKIRFYRQSLREPIPTKLLSQILLKQTVGQVFRRSKYLLLETSQGVVLFHLGMSGQLLWLKEEKPSRPHTHVVMSFRSLQKGSGTDSTTRHLHFVDPRRFGRIGGLLGANWHAHPFIAPLGVEPLEAKNLGRLLWECGQRSRKPIKSLLMDAKIVVGIGNIYACEALFQAGIHPHRPCAELSAQDYRKLASAIQATLRRAITAGGTTFRDFKHADGKPGYFAVALKVYGRKDAPCLSCHRPISMSRQAGRSSWFCKFCQK